MFCGDRSYVRRLDALDPKRKVATLNQGSVILTISYDRETSSNRKSCFNIAILSVHGRDDHDPEVKVFDFTHERRGGKVSHFVGSMIKNPVGWKELESKA